MIGRSLCLVERLCGHLSFRRSLPSASRTSRKDLGRRGTIRLFNFAQTPPARSCLICTTRMSSMTPSVPTPGAGLLLIAPAGVFSRVPLCIGRAHVGSTHVGFVLGGQSRFRSGMSQLPGLRDLAQVELHPHGSRSELHTLKCRYAVRRGLGPLIRETPPSQGPADA
jgi:hypothetical protein